MRHYCTESTYSFFYFFALINICIYPAGVPSFFILLMWREREQISDSINQKKYGFLFADYVQMYFLWEVIDLFRKLLLSGLMIFFQPGSVGQLLAGMIIALIFLHSAYLIVRRATEELRAQHASALERVVSK